MSGITSPSFAHLERMSDARGLFEHAEGTTPREEHGYCTDDNARLLVVTSRADSEGDETARRLLRLSLQFVRDAKADDGQTRNRMDITGAWTDFPSTEDCWGRSLWGLGTAASMSANPGTRRWALRAFDHAARQRSQYPRAMAFAALGAAEVVAGTPGDRAGRDLLADSLTAILGPEARRCMSTAWPWPEVRLRYANAALAEAVIAAGAALDRPAELATGLEMLRWLLERETAGGHLSVTGVGGRAPDEHGPQFDQQPIEVAAMADACWRAAMVTGDREWLRGVTAAADWFGGANDAGAVMFDAESGGGFDGLLSDGVNLNQGAESTLALVSTMQRAASLALAS